MESNNKIGILADYKVLLRNVPAFVTSSFILGTVLMNFAAAKVIVQIGGFAVTGGFVLSWLPFLCMDTVTKRFGARAAIMLNILSALGNLFAVVFMSIIAMCPGNGQDYSAFNGIYGSVWFIAFGSTVAFVVSGVINSLLNSAVGKLFVKNPDGPGAFFCRSYISTFVGQAIDNFLFLWIVYGIFAPIYWGTSLPVSTCIVTGIIGGLFELLVEAVFSPWGYRTAKRWKEEKVGQEYVDLHAIAE